MKIRISKSEIRKKFEIPNSKFFRASIFGFRIFILLLCASPLVQAEETYEAAQIPTPQLFVGERLVYQIKYLGVAIGESVSEITEMTEIRGRKAYHAVVKVRSYPAIDLMYKVRDEHHSYIDAEKKVSVRYEKNLREGFRRATEKLDYDLKKRLMTYSYNGKPAKQTYAPPNVQDSLSCGFWFRTIPVSSNSSIFIPTFAEGKTWKLEVKTYGRETVKIKKIGTFEALKLEPIMPFQGIFVKQGKITGWLSLDERRIPLKMTVKVPVIGNISAELVEYRPGSK